MGSAWVSPWWQAACLPKRWDVAGVIVPRLTVWHTFALENIGNAYLCGGLPDKDDAASLLLFAQRDMDGGRSLMNSQAVRDRAMSRMYRALRGDWPKIDAACMEYVEACTRAARRWKREQSGGKPYSVPHQWHLVRVLSRSMPYDAAWNFPYSEARCICDAEAEANGDDTIMRPDSEQRDDEAYERQKAAQCQQ